MHLRNRISTVLMGLLLLTTLQTASAQQAPSQSTSSGRISPIPDTLSDEQAAIINVLKVLDQVGVILPGKGFKSIQLGQTREQLVRAWGHPQQASRKAIQYQLDSRTVIQFVGRKTIDKIIVIGQPGSVARLENGVTFGMTPSQVTGLFDTQPDKQKNKLVRYKTLGIDFEFQQQILSRIIVYPARSR